MLRGKVSAATNVDFEVVDIPTLLNLHAFQTLEPFGYSCSELVGDNNQVIIFSTTSGEVRGNRAA